MFPVLGAPIAEILIGALAAGVTAVSALVAVREKQEHLEEELESERAKLASAEMRNRQVPSE
jgi:NDP-sugar pyrophosphorylase family protein